MNLTATFRAWLSLVLVILAAGPVWGQGVTTGNFVGVVQNEDGEPLSGATVMAVHTPTGTKYGAISREDGLYIIPNARVGGPYTVSATYVGYRADRRSDLYLNIGQRYQVNLRLSTSDVQLDEVVISATTGRLASERTGAETVITESQIDAMPTVSRSFGDFVRLTPQARVQEGNDGFAISLNGMNNRYNAIYIDGAVNNDVFGLAGSGTNGGQTGVSPISLDAIQEIQVSLAPFDVRVGGFAGGAINAVTRSGSNNLEASAYAFYRNQSLAGLTPTDQSGVTRQPLEDFTALTSGFRVGGAIIKNKLFYFVNAEIQRQETPQSFNFANYQGASSESQINTLMAKAVTLGYNPGSFTNSPSFLNSDKITVKLDWNFNENNTLSVRHGYVGARNLEGALSDNRNIRFSNSSEYFASVTNSTAIELNSILGSKWTNNLKIGATLVMDDRDPYQGAGSQSESNPNYFPYLQIDDGVGSIFLGSEPFSTANALDQTIITLTNNLTYASGDHVVTFGTHNEFFDVYNLFIRQNYGVYEYNDLQSVLDNDPADAFFRSYSLVDGQIGDGSAAAATFMGAQFGVYVQDDWTVAPNLTLTPGIRFDVPVYFDSPMLNEDFNERTIPLLEEQGYDLMGAQTGSFINPRLMVSPRLGFNWDVKGDRSTVIRGGVGVFTSRIPLVWPGGAFINNGVMVGSDQVFNPVYGINTFPRWNEQPQLVAPGQGMPSGQIDLFAEDFRIPQVLKYNVAWDQKLPWGIVGNVDVIYSNMLNNVAYQNLNIRPASSELEGTGDNRPIYNRRDPVDPTYGGIYLASNTNQGYSWNFTVSLFKPFQNGLSGTLAYSYGDAWAVFDGTSSQNSSQWRGLQTVKGRNVEQEISRSDFSQGHRLLGSVSYKIDWLKKKVNAGTTVTLFYEGVSGQPFSYIYDSFGLNGEINGEDSRERSLIYVPVNRDDIFFGQVTTAGNGEEIVTLYDEAVGDAMYSVLDAMIENDPYLSTRRGQYAERNMSRSPFSHVVDLRVVQDVYMTFGKKTHKLQLTADIFNLTNLINPEWGRRYFVGNDNNFELLDFVGFLNQADPNNQGQYLRTNVPVFTFPGEPSFSVDDSGIQSSRWQMQVGVRYLFQ